MVVPEGVDFDSLDGEKVNLIFLIAAPNTKENVHLDVLSKLSVLLMDEDFTANLRNAKTVDEFLHVIDAAEAEKDAETYHYFSGAVSGHYSGSGAGIFPFKDQKGPEPAGSR